MGAFGVRLRGFANVAQVRSAGIVGLPEIPMAAHDQQAVSEVRYLDPPPIFRATEYLDEKCKHTR